MKFLSFLIPFLLLSGSALAKPKVLIQTNYGNIYLELEKRKTPKTVKNFLKYVRKGFYNDLIFHRVVKDFVIQGGGYNKELVLRKPREPIVNEAENGLSNLRGTIAMARTREPHSATSQFYINHKDNIFLDYQSEEKPGYCAFGRVIKGMKIVDLIAGVKVGTGPLKHVPVKPVIIQSMKRIKFLKK